MMEGAKRIVEEIYHSKGDSCYLEKISVPGLLIHLRRLYRAGAVKSK